LRSRRSSEMGIIYWHVIWTGNRVNWFS
jgi:hypothetical protein